MFSYVILWPWLTGLIFFVLGLICACKRLHFTLDAVPALGPVFVAASLGVFGAEHLVEARFIMQLVPPWMPAHLFFAYFVGVALLAAALSFALLKHVHLSAPLVGLMFLLFVMMIHVPNVVIDPRDRFLWAVALRDLSFAAGAWALAGTSLGIPRLITVSRIVLGVVLIFFAVEHFLHAQFAPGVPLKKLTPPWIPLPVLWGYVVGTLLLITGAALLIDKQARAAAAWLGIVITLLVLIIYLPMLVPAKLPSEMIEAINYIADTLLFAGTILLVAAALSNKSAVPI